MKRKVIPAFDTTSLYDAQQLMRKIDHCEGDLWIQNRLCSRFTK